MSPTYDSIRPLSPPPHLAIISNNLDPTERVIIEAVKSVSNDNVILNIQE